MSSEHRSSRCTGLIINNTVVVAPSRIAEVLMDATGKVRDTAEDLRTLHERFAEEIMNLKDAMLCIDCDEVFVIEGSPANPRCPRCASPIMFPLSAWVPTWATLEHTQNETGMITLRAASIKRPGLKIVHPESKAA